MPPLPRGTMASFSAFAYFTTPDISSSDPGRTTAFGTRPSTAYSLSRSESEITLDSPTIPFKAESIRSGLDMSVVPFIGIKW